MMIAFITIESGFVPLLRVYALKSFILDLRLSVVLRLHLLLFFFERKNMLKEKAVISRSHPASCHIHTHVYFVHI